MIKHILIFLMLVSFVQAYTSWVVGGNGTGANAAATNAGCYDYTEVGTTTISWITMQGANGGPLLSADAAVSSDNGAGSVRLTSIGSDYSAAIVGMGARVDFADDEVADGIYYVVDVDGSNTWIDLDVDFAGDGENATATLGGALAEPGDVPDSGDVVGGLYLSPGDKVWIAAVKDYTTADESDSILYIDEPGTASLPITWEGHVGDLAKDINDMEYGDSGIVTFLATGKTNAIESAVGGALYHTFIGISMKNATDDGASINPDDNAIFVRCQTAGNGVWGLHIDRNAFIVLCDFDGDTSGGVSLGQFGSVVTCVFRNSVHGIDASNNLSAVGSLFYANTGDSINVTAGISSIMYANTFDGNNGGSTIGIHMNSLGGGPYAIANNIFTDLNIGHRDGGGSTHKIVYTVYHNIFNGNTSDTSLIDIVPVDGDVFGNVVDPASLFSSGYILHADVKGKGIDASYTKAYWDDFNGGAGDNPPSPLSGLSFMDNGALQREEAGGGGGQPIIGGSVVR